jgi:hypothetical protein
VLLLRGCSNASYLTPIALDYDNATGESMLDNTKENVHSLIALVSIATVTASLRTPGAPTSIIFRFTIRQHHAKFGSGQFMV